MLSVVHPSLIDLIVTDVDFSVYYKVKQKKVVFIVTRIHQ